MTIDQKLARLHNRMTRYELAAEHPDGRKILIGYTIHRSRHGLSALVRQRIEDKSFFKVWNQETWITWIKPAARGCTLDAWRVYFTGRTQRESIIEGELPFIADDQPATT